MAITRTLENAGTATLEQLGIIPFDRSGWVLMSDETDTKTGIRRVIHKQNGDTPEYPLVRIVTRRPATVFHPDYKGVEEHTGYKTIIAHYTVIRVEDSVSGAIKMVPYGVEHSFMHGSPVLLDSSDAFLFSDSAYADLWTDITAGVRNESIWNQLALGNVEI
jgi:hypothetical protein